LTLEVVTCAESGATELEELELEVTVVTSVVVTLGEERANWLSCVRLASVRAANLVVRISFRRDSRCAHSRSSSVVLRRRSSYRHTGGALVTSEAWGEGGSGRLGGMGAPRARVWRTGIALVAAWATLAARTSAANS
jgi:hypothetical protein